MITEDYVSFEVAKLLKEKGFECEKKSITAMYNESGKFHPLSTAVHLYYDYSDFDEYDYIAPTLQMAMKWLRKKYNICITIYPDKEKGYEAVLYHIKNDVEILLQSFGFYGFHIFGDSYEQACEAAIKYCLENLI